MLYDMFENIESLKVFVFKNDKIDLVVAKDFKEAYSYYTSIIGSEQIKNYEVKEIEDWHWNAGINIDATDLDTGESVIQEIPLMWAVEGMYPNKYTGAGLIIRTCKQEFDVIIGI